MDALRRLALEEREVELPDRLVDQAPVIGIVERLPSYLLGGHQGQGRDLGADLLERPARLGLDLAARLLEPPLTVGLRLLLHPLALRVGDPTRLREDLLRVRPRACDQRPVLFEQLARLVA